MISLKEKIKTFNYLWKDLSNVFYGVCDLPFDMDKTYEKYLNKILNSKTDEQYFLLLTEYVNLFNDGHTNVSLPKIILDKRKYLPFNLIYIKNKYYVCDTINELSNIKLCEIKSINNICFKKLLKKVFKYVHHKDNFAYHGRIETYLPFFLNKKRNKLLLSNGEKYFFDLLDEKPQLKTTFDLKTNIPFKKIDNELNAKLYQNSLYIELKNFNNSKQIEKCIDLIKTTDSKNIILDLRENEGGMTANAEKIANLFIEGTYSAYKKKTREFVGSNLASASQFVAFKDKIENWIKTGLTTQKEIDENNNYFYGKSFKTYTDCYGKTKHETVNKKLYVLTSGYTFSAGEDFVCMIKVNNAGTIVGQNTYGSTGTPFVEKFQNGFSVRVCSIGNELIDGTKFLNVGICPDIKLENNISNYKTNKDFVLENLLKNLQ